MLDRFFSVHRPPRLDWAQVELSTVCNAHCAYCAHTLLGPDRGLSRTAAFMDPALFARLLPQLAHTRFIHLQGWGETLLHPNFLPLLRMAKATGKPVSLTSNGTRLDETMAEALVAAGLDVLALSLAGASAAANARWRAGAGLAAVRAAAGHIARAKTRAAADAAGSGAAGHARPGGPGPRLHLAYMLLAPDLAELDGLPELAVELGAVQVVVSSLSLVLARAGVIGTARAGGPEDAGAGAALPPSAVGLDPAAALARDADALDRLRERVARVRARGRDLGVEIEAHLDSPLTPQPRCSENVGRAVVVAVDGSVHPCVMSALSGPDRSGAPGTPGTPDATDAPDGPWPWRVLGHGGASDLPELCFGSVAETSLGAIWRSPAYRRFRAHFARGRVPACCAVCRKRFVGPFPTEEECALRASCNRWDLIQRDIEARRAEREKTTAES
jgi:MoaA/NifB/PqqE/SkfB family radical SAM enzyme